MTRVLFCHDGPIRKDEANNYYGIAHNDKTFSRYYRLGNEIAIVIRVKKLNSDFSKTRFSKITIFLLESIECPNITSNVQRIFLNKKVHSNY